MRSARSKFEFSLSWKARSRMAWASTAERALLFVGDAAREPAGEPSRLRDAFLRSASFARLSTSTRRLRGNHKIFNHTSNFIESEWIRK